MYKKSLTSLTQFFLTKEFQLPPQQGAVIATRLYDYIQQMPLWARTAMGILIFSVDVLSIFKIARRFQSATRQGQEQVIRTFSQPSFGPLAKCVDFVHKMTIFIYLSTCPQNS